MSKLAVLMKKDYYINKKSYMIPIWIMIGIYILSIIAIMVAFIKADLDLNVFEIDFTDVDAPVLGISYIANLFIMGFPSLLCMIITLMLTQSALNEDIKRNFELFHRSQPVSVWLRSGSKFIMSIAGPLVVLLAITLVNAIVVNSVLIYTHFFSFSGAFQAIVQSSIQFVKIALVLGSICFLASAIFKDKALLNTIGILLGIQVLFMIVNVIYGIHLPLPFNYLKELFDTNIASYEGKDFLQQDASTMINLGWREVLFNWKTLLQLAFSGILFAGATLLYRNREVK